MDFEFFYSLRAKDNNKKGLEPFFFLLEKLCLRPLCFECIHVAGTNGKGSVCEMLAKAYGSQYKVGKFTSPHLVSPTERIEINSIPIDPQVFLHLLQKVYKVTLHYRLDIGFFGLCFLSALLYFQENQIELAIIETGIGGLLDSTNCVDPILSIITTIGLDHTAILGDSIEQIAVQKGGIIKPFVPVVLGAKANLDVIKEIANQKQAPCFVAKPGADFLEENQSIFEKSVLTLQKTYPLSATSIEQGKQATLKARFQKIKEPIYLDGGHNLQAFEALIGKLKTCVCVLTFLKDKPIEHILKALETKKIKAYLFPLDHERACSFDELVQRSQFFSNTKVFETFEQAFIEAQRYQKTILIAGSFYMVDKVLSFFDHNQNRTVFSIEPSVH
jgi:dihydrofolate synthase/folylpolyglutamate synthase